VPPPPQDPPPPELPPQLVHLSAIWEDALGVPRTRVVLAGFTLIVFGGAHLARLGTPAARAAVVVVAVGWLLSALVLAAQRRLRASSAVRMLHEVVAPADEAAAGKSLRALKLRARAATDPSVGSPALARLHLDRSLQAISVERIRDVSERRARILGVVALALFVLAIVSVAGGGPLRVIEGLDVLVARHDMAPLPLTYLDDVEIDAHPPDYLKQKAIHRGQSAGLEVPYGTLLTIRGSRLRAGRTLLLGDGQTEVPFVDDGTGALVARWTVKDSVSLFVAAKFGRVRIAEPGKLGVVSIPDQAPVVEVEGAPRTVRLLEETEVPIRYRATDDHGLREVNLVLRSGTAEQRRVLSKLDGDTRSDQGGYQLRSTDRFVRQSFLPVEVTVEARDNDPLTGPKWGKSPALLLLPPALGEPEALRYEALVKVHDEVIDLLARRLEATPPTGAARRAWNVAEGAEIERVMRAVEEAMDGTYGNLTVPRRLGKLAAGQIRKVTETTRKSVASGQWNATTAALETATLALDGGLRSLATRDAQSAAKRLSKVAALAADGFLAARTTEEGPKARARADAALSVIEPSGKAIRRLGTLGGDLGSIVANDLERIQRSLSRQDLFHAELVARDLAARLAKPSPSFVGGTSGRGGGAEGGGGQPDPSDEAGSDAEDAMEAGERALDDLARDHAGNVSDVEQAMAQAESGEDTEAAREEAKRHAAAVREAVRSLPRSGSDPSSSSAAAAAAREHALAMAEALERGALKDAVEGGRASAENLGEASRAGENAWDEGVQREARDAKQKLDPEVQWAEQAFDRLKKRLADRAKVAAQKNREGELADRARGLADRGDRGEEDAAMPGSTLEHLRQAENKMREAQRELGKGDVQRALEQQRDAQRSLDAARAEKDDREGEDKDGGGHGENDGREFAGGNAPIPKADEYRGPEEFRRRVLEGLANGGSRRLRPAVQRYAEKLLR
jgi:hypothetical protein